MSKFLHILSVALLLIAFIGCEKKPVDDGGKTPEEPVFERYQKNQQCSINIVKGYLYHHVLLPAEYNDDEETRYPVVYMLHGYGETISTWDKGWVSLIQSLEAAGLPPMIYVFPTGWDSYYCNAVEGGRQYMDMFIQEFVPYIDKNYRTIADREHRAVMGYSMGGFGAMALPLRNPDIFGASVPLSMSFRTDEQYMTEPAGGWDYQWGEIFGGKGLTGADRLTDYYKSHCPFYQFVPENKESLSRVKWFFHCGDNEEQLLIANDNLHVQLRDNGYDHEFRIGDGGHSDGYWRNAAKEALPWLSHVMNEGGEWDRSMTDVTVVSSELNEDGSFSSKAYKESETKGGLAIYLAYRGVDAEVIEKMMGLLSQKGGIFPYMILPCDLDSKTLTDWMGEYSTEYNVGMTVDASHVIALGDAGRDVWNIKDRFSRYYFIDADIAEDESTITADKDRFYYIDQTDDGANYRDMNALYRACMKVIPHIDDRNFEYRMRNGLEDKEKELLLAAKSVADNLKFE